MKIAGLEVLRSFCSPSEARAIFGAASRLSLRATDASLNDGRKARTSDAHNINSREEYKSLALPLDDDEGTATCEHFANYGDGHALTYFRSKLPSLGAPQLRERFYALPSVRTELISSRQRLGRPEDADLKWKLTLNRYDSREPGPAALRPGFPWHRDLESNGCATFILNLGGSGSLEFGEEPKTDAPVDGMRYSDHTAALGAEVPVIESVDLHDGDLLVITDEARWTYLHRVLPNRTSEERVSLVYGVW